MVYEKFIHSSFPVFVKNVAMRDLNLLDSEYYSLLMAAIESELIINAVFLLRMGADPNLRSGYCETLPISRAILIDNPALISILIAFGASVDNKTSCDDERTPRELIYLNPYLAGKFDSLLCTIKIPKPIKISKKKRPSKKWLDTLAAVIKEQEDNKKLGNAIS